MECLIRLLSFVGVRGMGAWEGQAPHPPTFQAVCTFLFTLAFRKNNSKNELQKNSHKSNDINGFRTFYNRSKY